MEFSCYEMSILVDFVIGKLRVFFFSSVLGFAPFWLGLPWVEQLRIQACSLAFDTHLER